MDSDLRTRAAQMAAWQYRAANRILSGENNVPPVVGANLAQSGGLTTELLARIEELTAAGDALAHAAREGLADIRDRSPVRPPLLRALAAWAAARGDAAKEGDERR